MGEEFGSPNRSMELQSEPIRGTEMTEQGHTGGPHKLIGRKLGEGEGVSKEPSESENLQEYERNGGEKENQENDHE